MTHNSSSIHQNTRDQLLKIWPEMFPGIDRVVMLFVTSENESGGAEIALSGNKYGIKELDTEGIEDRLLKMRNEQAGYSWLHKDQLPFEQKTFDNTQPELFSEQYHIVLMLRFKSHIDGSMDAYYLFFREDQSNFGISRLQGSLDTTRKALVGSLVFRFAGLFYQSISGWQNRLSEFTNVTKQLLSVQLENNQKNDFRIWVSQWSDDYLENLSNNQNVQLKLSENALTRLYETGDFKTASEALRKAADFALLLNTGSKLEVVIIEENYLLIAPINSQNIIGVNQTSLPGRLTKTMLFLDKLEKAAHKLMEQGEDLTSSGVGQIMDRPITAPAITDALRKNRRRVLTLLEQHPGQWPLIRQQFRPLINIIEKKEELRNIS